MGKVKHGSDRKDAVTNYGFYAIFGLVTYFIWCDLSFFGELSAEKTSELRLKNSTLISRNTIKLRMLDHFGHYIFLPFCRWANEFFLISDYPWVTPNLITAMHFCIAICCGRLFASSLLTLRRIAVILFEVRSLLDILDGVIYRAQAKSNTVLSGWGTYGYIIDGMADTLGGLFIMIGTLYRFNRYPPVKNADNITKIKSRHDKDLEANDRLLMSDDSCTEDVDEAYGIQRYSRKHVNLVVAFFTLTVIMRSALWDHFNHNYHNLLGIRRPDINPVRE